MSARSAQLALLNAPCVLLVRRMKTVTQRLLATCALLEVSLLPVLRRALRVLRVLPARSLLKALSPAVHAPSERTALLA